MTTLAKIHLTCKINKIYHQIASLIDRRAQIYDEADLCNGGGNLKTLYAIEDIDTEIRGLEYEHNRLQKILEQ